MSVQPERRTSRPPPPTAAQPVNQLMQGVVATPKGTADGVGFPPQDKVAAKTGTAQVGHNGHKHDATG